jgi:hypothetical protein
LADNETSPPAQPTHVDATSTVTPAPMSFEALKSLYDGQLGTLKVLSERSFATTLQALTLNVLVVAGLVGGKTELSVAGRLIASAVLVLFNVAITAYLVSKSRAHHREKKKLAALEGKLAELAHWPYGKATQSEPSYWKSFFGGSFLMVLAVLLGCTCATFGLWVTLVQRPTPEDISVVLKAAPPTPTASATKRVP